MIDDWRMAARYGLPFGVGLSIFAAVIAVLHALFPAPQVRELPYFWLMAAIICAFLSGFIAARTRRSFTLGVDAGAVACAAPGLIIFLISLFGSTVHYQQTHPIGQYLPGVVNAVIALALLVPGGIACGAVVGGLAGIPGALLGRIQGGLDNSPHPPTEQQAAPSQEAEISLARLSSREDIVIPLSWPKSLLFLVLTSLFAAVAYSLIRSGQTSALNWIALCLFGLGVPLFLANLVLNHPLVRFSEDRIRYRGGYLWLRGEARWQDVQAILLEPATERTSVLGLLGRYDLRLILTGKWNVQVRFLSWQLPSSTQKRLLAATIRYRKQIEENEVVIQGIE